MYRILYFCYMTKKRLVQKQLAFISLTQANVRVGTGNSAVDKKVTDPLIDVAMFESLEEAMKDAAIYCPQDCIFVWEPDKESWRPAQVLKNKRGGTEE